MKKTCVLIVFIFLFFQALSLRASHIVGGEFQLLHKIDQEYELYLILFFDVINGNPAAKDQTINARIYRKSDNAPMMDVNLPFLSQSRVENFQPACSNGEVITDKLIYTTTITLSDNIYNDPEGYYVVWERCCRNYNLSNIVSEDPQAGGQHSGQTFYLEFPAVVKNGEPFVNSSPQLFPPLTDYACPNRTYWVDFSGFDADGDSLAYTLVTPISTHNAVAIPNGGPGPAPFPVVTWQSPFSLGNIMNGAPDLKVSGESFLTVTPTQAGLYAFAVKCEEFRDNEKIGEVIRDFQMLVLGSCPVAEPPQIAGRKLNEVGFTHPDKLSVTFANTVADVDRCIEVQISDLDALKAEDNFTENIWLKAIPLNFITEKNLNEVLPTISSATLVNGSVETFMICFDQCPYVENGPFRIGVIAFDDACALPLSDTLEIDVAIESPLNAAPTIITSGNDVPNITINKDEGIRQNTTFQIEGVDTDNRILSMEIIPVGLFDMAKSGMSFTTPDVSTPGLVFTTFDWNLDCLNGDLDFSEGVTISQPGEVITKQYKFYIVVNDEEDCFWTKADTLEMELNIKFPGEYGPNVFQVGRDEKIDSLGYRFNLKDDIRFDITSIDSNNDNLTLFSYGSNFEMESFGAKFDDVNNMPSGAQGVTSSFEWFLDPSLISLSEIDSFRVYFITEDLDACNITKGDTLTIDFLIGEYITSLEPKTISSSELNIYPNPTRNVIYVALDRHFEQEPTFLLYNLNGKEVMLFEQVLKDINGYNLMVGNGLKSGVYVLHVIVGDTSYVNKIMLK